MALSTKLFEIGQCLGMGLLLLLRMVKRYEASERLFSALELLFPASASDLPDIVNIHTKNKL